MTNPREAGARPETAAQEGVVMSPGVVTIHVESGDHTVAASSPKARRAMRRTHPSGLLLLYTVGPAEDYGLARRMAGLSLGARRK